MKVTIDPRAGFCGGVKRVIRMAETHLQNKTPIVALGEIIHNHSESRRLEALGLQVKDHSVLTESGKIPAQASLLIRAHGEPPATFKTAEKLGLRVIDGTCPIVIHSQKLAEKYYRQGYQVVIIGKKGHAEVEGIAGYCNGKAVVVSSEEDLEKVNPRRKTFVLVQTTFSEKKFQHMTDLLQQRGIDLTVRNTICSFISGRDRQMSAFARQYDVVVMVGGRHSSNTRVLFEICRERNNRSYWVEKPAELEPHWFTPRDRVGITGGASTPQWLMEQVKQKIESFVESH